MKCCHVLSLFKDVYSTSRNFVLACYATHDSIPIAEHDHGATVLLHISTTTTCRLYVHASMLTAVVVEKKAYKRGCSLHMNGQSGSCSQFKRTKLVASGKQPCNICHSHPSVPHVHVDTTA